MRIARILVGVVAVTLSAQTPPDAPRGFGPPMASAELAKQPQTKGAKGDQERHYYFEAAKQEMPYHLVVPQKYNGKTKMPLVVALHGYGGNQDYFSALVKNLPELCEQYGFIFVAPMGYSIGGWYGAPLSIPGNLPRSGSKGKQPPPSTQTPEEAQHERDLSEADVMNVIDLVSKEYKVDSQRIYLMGHSMGGFGTYYLGQKYASKWAAIAPMSGTMANADYHLDRLARVPILVAVGSTETATAENAKAQIETMKKMGMTTAYVEIEGGTHMSMIAPTVPQIFAFFATQKKK
jgi:predicted peptidase